MYTHDDPFEIDTLFLTFQSFYLCILVNDRYCSIRFPTTKYVKVENGTLSRSTEHFHQGIEFKSRKI